MQRGMMMGLGSLGNGGPSSSSSSLSPLAPPFTVDRSNPKPNSNQLLQFSDSVYATPFNHNWACPHPSDPASVSTSLLDLETDSTRMTCLPLSNDYHCQASESINSLSAHWPTLNPSGQSVTDAFLYSGEPKPYDHQYVSPAVQDTTHMATVNHPSYDISATPGFPSMNPSSPVEYTGRLSGLECAQQWGSFWNGLADEKQSKLIALDGSACSCLEENNVIDSFVYKKNVNQGNHIAEGMTQYEKLSAISLGKHSDAFGTENYAVSLNTGQLDDKLLLAQDISLIPFGSPRTPTSRTCSAIPHSHPQAPCLESVTNSLQYVPYQKCFEPLDSRLNNCISITKSSPSLVIRPPATGTISSAPNTVSSKIIDTSNVMTVNNGASDSRNFSKVKGPLVPQSAEFEERCLDASGLSFHKERNSYINAASSSTVGEESNKQLTVGNLDHVLEARYGFQDPDINSPAGFSLAIDGDINSTENSTDCLDHHSTAVDSPCWKGAPGFHFSPFEVATPQLLTNRLEACDTLNLQGTQTFPPHSGPMNVLPQKPYENNNLNERSCVDNCFSLSQKGCSDANDTAKVHRSGDDEKSGNSGSKVVQFSEDIEKPCNYDFLSALKSDCEPSHTRKLRLEEGNSTSTKVKRQGSVADSGIETTDVSEDGQFPAVKNVSCLLSFGEDAADFAKPYARESTPKMDVHMLVHTMCNLSELLRFHCSVNSYPLEEHDHKVLKYVMDNLHACLSKKVVHLASIPESVVPQDGTHYKSSSGQHMCTSIGQSPVTSKAAANSIGQLDCQHIEEGKGNYNASGKKVDKLVNYTSSKNDAEGLKFDCMVQAIKAVLDENFQSEEEVESQTLLYKNLWLEAEAELCSINYRTRHDRMKIEMKKSKLGKAKAGEDSPASGSTSHVDDVDASVMARFHILKCRGENSKSINMEEHLPGVVSIGFAGEGSQRPLTGDQLEDGVMNMVAKPHGQREHEIIKEFRICIPDDPMVHFVTNDKQPNHPPSGWYDNTPSDWEHVLKDDYALQN